jgi:hypothetical protein
LARRFENLTYQVLFESYVAHADGQQGENVFRVDGAEEIKIRSMLEELC